MIQLREYQQRISSEAAELLRKYRICYLAMECRTGKTLTAYSAADAYGAKSVLIVTKLKAFASVRNDHALLQPHFTLDVVNYESAHKMNGKKYDLIILDEAHSLGTFPKPSKRAKAIKELCNMKPIIYLSGTPSPESYSQLYHQFWVSSFSPWRLFSTFYKWAKVFVNVKPKRVNGFAINDYSDANKAKIDATVKHLFIDYSQEEAGFDANIVERTLTVPMTAITESLIATLQRDRVAWYRESAILGDTPAKLMSKLHQLSSGSVIGEDGEHITIDFSKAQYIRSYFAGQKIAIFYVYQSEADLLHEVFPDWTDSPEEFQRSGISKVFICQVRRAREGVRLDTADALIFYNLEYSFLSYEQGRNRLVSKERVAPANVYFVVSDCGIESEILEAVHNKEDYTYQYYKSKRR